MTTVTIRQSGGADIISIPKSIGKTLGLHAGSKLKLSIVDNRIVLEPEISEVTLEELLAESPKECFQITAEDSEWIDAKSVGKEI